MKVLNILEFANTDKLSNRGKVIYIQYAKQQLNVFEMSAFYLALVKRSG